MTTINNYKTNKKCRQWQRLYSCHSKRNVRKKNINQYIQSKNKFRSVYTIKKIIISISTYNQKKNLLTKMILDTAVTSEDLSHTTMKKNL